MMITILRHDDLILHPHQQITTIVRIIMSIILLLLMSVPVVARSNSSLCNSSRRNSRHPQHNPLLPALQHLPSQQKHEPYQRLRNQHLLKNLKIMKQRGGIYSSVDAPSLPIRHYLILERCRRRQNLTVSHTIKTYDLIMTRRDHLQRLCY